MRAVFCPRWTSARNSAIEIRARRTVLQRSVLVGAPFEQGLELKEQCRAAQLVVCQIVDVRHAEGECERARVFIAGVVEETLGVGQRLVIEGGAARSGADWAGPLA